MNCYYYYYFILKCEISSALLALSCKAKEHTGRIEAGAVIGQVWHWGQQFNDNDK